MTMVSWMARIQEARAELAQRDADPLRDKVETAVRGMEAVSTNALLDLVGLPPTTGNARRVSRTMQSLGYVAIKSRCFIPGGWRDTVTRGWARPFRDVASQQGATMPASKDPSTVPERVIRWNERASQWGEGECVTVWIDVRKLDALLPLASKIEHVRFAGENGILDKYADFDKFVRSHKRIIMPCVKIERACKEHPDQDIAYIFNGRHRFAWMRDHGAQALPVAVLRSEANEVAKLVGTSARECRVTMDRIPEWKRPWMK